MFLVCVENIVPSKMNHQHHVKKRSSSSSSSSIIKKAHGLVLESSIPSMTQQCGKGQYGSCIRKYHPIHSDVGSCWHGSLLVLALCAAAAIPCLDAFTPLYHCQRHSLSSYSFNHCPALFAVTPASDLHALTIPQLKDLVKSLDGMERGLLSRLKKKKDLIEYLQQQQPDLQQQQPDLDQSNRFESSLTNTFRRRKKPLQMPPMEDLEPTAVIGVAVNPTDQEEADVQQQKSPPAFTSLKDHAFEHVYQRFPPLRPKSQQQAAGATPTFESTPINGDTHQRTEATTTTSMQSDMVVVDDGDDVDVRDLYHPFLDRTRNTSSDMDIIFLGTASCSPGTTRGVSCTAVRLNWKRRQRSAATTTDNAIVPEYSNFVGGTWLFDVGECTQLQIRRTPNVKPSKITKIFLTHAHGDHTFGLPGLLCFMGQDRDKDSPPVDIYGPEGLRMWLRVAIRYSVSRIVPPYRVHEICHVPMAPEWELNRRTGRYFCRGSIRRDTDNSSSSSSGAPSNKRWSSKGLAGEDDKAWISVAPKIAMEPSLLYGEIEGGRDIFPIYDHALSSDGAPVWEVDNEDDVKVYAAPMSHGIPCLGYVIDEQSRPGKLHHELVEPIVKRNWKALVEAGFKVPMKAMAVIKNLPPDSAFTFPDGTVVMQAEAVEPPRQGRKLVICGDTADSRAMEGIARNADIVVHEATNTYLPGVDKDTHLDEVTRDAMIHGHSTPFTAGEFAKNVRAERLLLNHFSSRYKGDPSVDSLSIMMRIEKQAMTASGLDECNVAAAWDLMVIPVPQK